MSLSKNKIKFIQSLSLKKNRDKESVFVAEGIKLVGDLLPYFRAKYIIAMDDWFSSQENILADEVICIDSLSEMKKISLLSTPSSVFAVFYKPDLCGINEILLDHQLLLALDGIQDPGNIGTIVRVADWFGIRHILCSKDTVDIYNAKSVQATMGALSRVQVHYVDLATILNSFQKQGWPVYGTFLDGDSIYSRPLSKFGIIVMGNEGNGISNNIKSLISDKLLIPNYPIGRKTSESLNVAVATSIVCSEFIRRLI